MPRLLCVDPGGDRGHTGVVLLHYEADIAPTVAWSGVIKDGWEGIKDFCWPVAEHAVVEKFVNWNTPGADLSVVLTEGAILLSLWDQKFDVTRQGSAGKNTAVPDEVLKASEMWFPGDHHNDRREAARHGFLWLRKIRHEPTLRLILAHAT